MGITLTSYQIVPKTNLHWFRNILASAAVPGTSTSPVLTVLSAAPRAVHRDDVPGNPGIGSNLLVRSLRTLNPQATKEHSTMVTAK